MDLISSYVMQLKEAHGFLEATMADVTPEVANFIPPGRANSVGACYAHVICGEDLAINGMLKGGAPLFVSSHLGKTGLLSGAGLGMRTVAWVLSRAVIGHADNFSGEISAIKGVQGKKGYPA
jgi:hypothetical protein